MVEESFGVQRWPVKTLSDADAERVDFMPVTTTVADLISLPVPFVRSPNLRVTPVELTTYTVTAELVEAKLEADSDIHPVIADLNDPNKTMIVEFPDAPDCTLGADPELLSQMQTARAAFVAAFGLPPSIRFMPLSGIAQITGVGFFDLIHGQRGVAPNGIELHPVLRFAVVGQGRDRFHLTLDGVSEPDGELADTEKGGDSRPPAPITYRYKSRVNCMQARGLIV